MTTASLAGLQQWMQTVITTPGTMQERLTRAGGMDCETLVVSDGRATATDRIRVYASGYEARLSECLAADFPALGRWLGEDVFQAFCRAYIRRYPSASATLFDFGARFPQFLAAPPARSGEVTDARSAVWMQMPSVLATLERAVQEALRAPGLEDQPAAAPAQDLFGLLPGACRISRPACLTILQLPFPVLDFYHILLQHRHPDLPDPETAYHAVSRRGYQLTTATLTAAQHACLSAASAAPRPLSGIVEEAAAGSGLRPSALLAELTLCLPAWQQQGFVRVHPL